MPEEMANFLMSYYGFSVDTAREILAELHDTKSLQSLVGYRGARPVQGENTGQIYAG